MNDNDDPAAGARSTPTASGPTATAGQTAARQPSPGHAEPGHAEPGHGVPALAVPGGDDGSARQPDVVPAGRPAAAAGAGGPDTGVPGAGTAGAGGPDAGPPGTAVPYERSAGGQNWLRVLALLTVIVGVLALAAAAFVFSYSGVHDIAVTGGVHGGLARFFPAALDAILVVACAATLALRGARWWTRWLAWLSVLVIAAAVASADAVHAMGVRLPRRPTAAAVAVTPWVLLLLGLRLWLSVLRHPRAGGQMSASAARPQWAAGSPAEAAPDGGGPGEFAAARTGRQAAGLDILEPAAYEPEGEDAEPADELAVDTDPDTDPEPDDPANGDDGAADGFRRAGRPHEAGQQADGGEFGYEYQGMPAPLLGAPVPGVAEIGAPQTAEDEAGTQEAGPETRAGADGRDTASPPGAASEVAGPGTESGQHAPEITAQEPQARQPQAEPAPPESAPGDAGGPAADPAPAGDFFRVRSSPLRPRRRKH